MGILSGFVLNNWTERSQASLKAFEVTFPEKQKQYAKLMRLLSDSFYGAAWRQSENHYKIVDEIEATYFGLEPFLSEPKRKATWEAIQSFIEFCNQLSWQDLTTDMEIEVASQEFINHRDRIRAVLFPELFARKSM